MNNLLKTTVYVRQSLLHLRRHEISFCTGLPDPIPPFTYPMFESWCKKYGKTYASEKEKRKRFKLVTKSYEIVEKHNSSDSPYTLKLNKFADLTDAEAKRMCSGCLPPIRRAYYAPPAVQDAAPVKDEEPLPPVLEDWGCEAEKGQMFGSSPPKNN